MSRSSQTKIKPRTGYRQYFTEDGTEGTAPTVKKNQRLSKSQIITFWSGSLILLLASFVIGFKAGQKIGAKEVLDQAANQVIRLPIVRPIGRESETVSLAKLEPPTKKTKKVEEVVEENRKMDFTSQSENVTSIATQNQAENTLDPTNQKNTKKDSEEGRYEIIYPGKDKFLPPEKKKKEEEEVKKEVPLIELNPVIKEPEKPVFNVNALKPSPGWYVQVTAVPTTAEVENIHNKLVAKNINVKVESASIRNRPYYRILFGPYADRGTALEKITYAKQQAATPGEPFIRQVK